MRWSYILREAIWLGRSKCSRSSSGKTKSGRVSLPFLPILGRTCFGVTFASGLLDDAGDLSVARALLVLSVAIVLVDLSVILAAVFFDLVAIFFGEN